MQAAATARIADENCINLAAARGDVDAVEDYVIADVRCLDERIPGGDEKYDCTASAPACISTLALLLTFCSISTPLHDSASGGHVEACVLLLLCNADIQATNCEYNSHRCMCL